jgi:hypothetical protein
MSKTHSPLKVTQREIDELQQDLDGVLVEGARHREAVRLVLDAWRRYRELPSDARHHELAHAIDWSRKLVRRFR